MKLKPNPWLRQHLKLKPNEPMDLHSITMEQMGKYADLYQEYLKTK